MEDKLLWLVFKDPENLNLIEEAHYNLFCETTKNFVENLKKIKPAAGMDLKASFADFSQKEEYKDFLNTLFLRAEVDFEEDGPDEILLCLAELKDINVRVKRAKISAELKKAEQEKDFEKVNKLIGEFNLIN